VHQSRIIFDAMEGNQKLLDLMFGPQFGALKMFEGNQKLLDSISGRNSILRMVEHSHKLLDSISSRASFASMVGANTTLAQIAAQPDFASMIGTATMPRPAWIGVFDGLREQVGADLYDEALAEFNTAADLAGEADGETWWVLRLRLVVQLALLVPVLQVVDKMSEFMADLAGEDLPPAYRSGTQVLFALAAVLLVFIDAKAEALADDDDPD
jgi:hypothetical protein